MLDTTLFSDHLNKLEVGTDPTQLFLQKVYRRQGAYEVQDFREANCYRPQARYDGLQDTRESHTTVDELLCTLASD